MEESTKCGNFDVAENLVNIQFTSDEKTVHSADSIKLAGNGLEN